jgi:hypothetical protein
MAHAESKHGVVFNSMMKEFSVPKYDAATQATIHEVLVKGFVAQQLLPFSVFEGDGIASALTSLLPRLSLPSHQTVARIVERLDTQHLAKVQEIIATITDAPTPIAVSEVDCWPAPTEENYFGLLIHGLTAQFSPVTVLLYADVLGVPETAQNQGQRMISVANGVLTRDITELCWANQSDNTGKAVNVAAALQVEGLCCVARLLALGPRHLLHPVRRTTSGLHRMVAPERAQNLRTSPHGGA